MTDVNAVGATQQATTSSSSSLSQLGEDYTRFLTLLTAQISNQDPLAPMDSTQFVSQLAQLSQVEQAVKTNGNLETLQGQIGSMITMNGANMLGRSVTVSSDKIALNEGVADQSYYQLSQDGLTVNIEIWDPTTDRLVRTIEGAPNTPDELLQVPWDGRNSDGAEMLDGFYSFKINAVDSEGNEVPVYTYRKTEVQEVLFTDGQNFYTLDGDETVPEVALLATSL